MQGGDKVETMPCEPPRWTLEKSTLVLRNARDVLEADKVKSCVDRSRSYVHHVMYFLFHGGRGRLGCCWTVAIMPFTVRQNNNLFGLSDVKRALPGGFFGHLPR